MRGYLYTIFIFIFVISLNPLYPLSATYFWIIGTPIGLSKMDSRVRCMIENEWKNQKTVSKIRCNTMTKIIKKMVRKYPVKGLESLLKIASDWKFPLPGRLLLLKTAVSQVKEDSCHILLQAKAINLLYVLEQISMRKRY